MNQRDLIRSVADTTGLTQAVAKDAVEGTLRTISNELRHGGDVRLKGFGTFTTKRRAERTISGPIGQGKTVPAHEAPVFKPSKELKDAVR